MNFSRKFLLSLIGVMAVTAATAKTPEVAEKTKRDKQGVPIVRDAVDPVVDGQLMSYDDFLFKYCVGKYNNQTCVDVLQAKRLSTKPRK